MYFKLSVNFSPFSIHSELNLENGMRIIYLKDYSRFFQEIGPHAGAYDMKMLVEINLNVFAKSRGIVISRGFCIANGLHDRRGSQNPFFNLSLSFRGAANGSEISHCVFGTHSFSRT